MNVSIKPHQLVAHWVPGFIVLTMWLLADAHDAYLHTMFRDPHFHIAAWQKIKSLTDPGLGLILVLVVPFALGQFLDALRGWWEDLVDRKPESKVGWSVMGKLSEDRLAIFQDYFESYVFSANLCLGLVVGFSFNPMSKGVPVGSLVFIYCGHADWFHRLWPGFMVATERDAQVFECREIEEPMEADATGNAVSELRRFFRRLTLTGNSQKLGADD